jgi:hypothetical protein
MAKNETPSQAELLAGRLDDARRAEGAIPRPGARELPVLYGVGKAGVFAGNQENVLAAAADILVQCGRVYRYGSQVAMEVDWQDGTGPRLVPLRTGGKVEGGAEDWVANVMVCGEEVQGQAIQFAPPRPLMDVLLRCEPALARLPRITQYSRVPLYDEQFVLRGPGWHPSAGVLIHGPAVEPTPFRPGDPALPVVQRLPRHLRTLLTDFCFAGPSDAANALGLLLTGVLLNHFVTPTKPMVLLDGNQPGVGKTLLARTVGVVLGGTDPRPISYTADDDELAKRLCATVREEPCRVLIVDNAKVRGGSTIDSPTLEANSMAPEISFRILGLSQNYTRPNDLLWFLTMNDSKTSSDMVSRMLPIRLAFEGDPRDRRFGGLGPVAYARECRVAILAELAGIVDHWTQSGRPEGTRGHRCGHWAKVAGGIMCAAGFPEFLGNIDEAAVTFNGALDELAALAEFAIAIGGNNATAFIVPADVRGGMAVGAESRGAPAKDWVPVFVKAGVMAEVFEKGSRSSKGTKIGKFFSPFIGREVPIEPDGRVGRAVLHVENGRSRERRYYFAVSWEDANTVPTSQPAPCSGTAPIGCGGPGIPALSPSSHDVGPPHGTAESQSTSGNSEDWQ